MRSLSAPRFADAELVIAQKARTSVIDCFIRSILTFGRNPQLDCCLRILSFEMSVPFANPAKARMIAA
jgi:hypothetical protein